MVVRDPDIVSAFLELKIAGELLDLADISCCTLTEAYLNEHSFQLPDMREWAIELIELLLLIKC